MAEAPPSVTILRVRVLEGEGDVFPAGARTARPIAVHVTDETGKPVEGATVSFSLPTDGPSGSFAGNMRTDIALTSADGKAVMSGVEWNQTIGPFSVRVTAAKERVRAGVAVSAYLAEKTAASASARAKTEGRVGWKKVALIVGAASAAGLAIGWSRGQQPGIAGAQQQPETSVGIGAPTISIGKP